MRFVTLDLFHREQRRENIAVYVAITRGNGAFGEEKQESDMERECQVETAELAADELENVSGGLTVTFGSSWGKVGVALNAAQGGSKAAAAYWLLFG